MAKIKYFLEYSDNEGIISRLEIWDKDFLGDPTEINGNVTLNYADRKDLLQYSVPLSLDMTLEASEEMTLQDLYTESENQFKVKFFIDGQLVFFGNLIPDGFFEDWVNDKWELTSLSAIDGLSILKDLSFVTDVGGFYEGKITQFEALKQCLHRIGYDLPINVSNDLPTYVGFADTDSILHNVQMNADRFYQDAQKNNIMDCEEVLKSILEPYNATIFQMNGEWWVVRSLDFKPVMTFKKYDGLVKSDVIWNSEYFIGSHIDDYEIHLANANQKKSVNSSAQAFRVNYKYGLVKNIISNPNIEVTDLLISDGWIINNLDDSVRAQDDNTGIIFQTDDQTLEGYLIELNQNVTLGKGESVSVNLDLDLLSASDLLAVSVSLRIETDNFVYDYDKWIPKSVASTTTSVGVALYGTEHYNLQYNFDNIPETSLLTFKVYVNSYIDTGLPVNYSLFINSIEIIPTNKQIYKGEFHTAQRSTRISSVTKNDKTVSVGDSLSDIYLGTLYKSDNEPTELWNRSGMTDNKGLLRLMVEDTLRISPRPMLYFEGDIFGYIPYMALISINNLPGKYQVSRYSYSSVSGINRTAFKEFSTDLLAPEDYRYEFEFDFGSETKVTILP